MSPILSLEASLADWAKLLTAVAAVMAAAIAAATPVIRWLMRRSDSDLVNELDARYFSMVRESLKAASARAGPENTRIIDITFVGVMFGHMKSPTYDNPLRIPVIRDTWLTVLPGTDLMGDEFGLDKTTYFLRCDNTTRIRRHLHEGEETVQVIQGTMTNALTGEVFGPGDTWTIAPKEVHSVLFEAPDDGHGLFLITVRPPLPDSSQQTILLDGMHRLAP